MLINNQGPKKSIDPPEEIGFQTYQETHYIIGKSTLYSILASLEFGLEIAQEALIEHDQYLGRTIMKNKMWAEELEREIEKFKNRIKEMKGLLNDGENK